MLVDYQDDLTLAAPILIDFRLRNQQGQHVLYTRLPEQSLELEIVNTSRRAVVLQSVDEAASPEVYHFCLTFRPGTLWEPANIRLGGDGSRQWDMHVEHRKDDSVALYFAAKAATELAHRDHATIALDNVAVDGRGGARGTRVMLAYDNLESALGSLRGSRLHYVSVLDAAPDSMTTPQPLTAGWVGSNTAVNNGQLNQLRLRVKNTSGGTLSLDDDSRISLIFPHSDGSWGLLGQTDVPSLSVEAVTQSEADGEQVGTWEVWTDPEQTTDRGIEVILSPQDHDALDPGATVDISISFKSTATNGVSDLVIHYDGFSHLEGEMHVPIIVGPLVIREQDVGVEVANPDARLTVRTDPTQQRTLKLHLDTSTWPSAEWGTGFRFIETSTTVEGGEGKTKTLSVGAFGVGIGFDPPPYDSPDALYVNGKVGIGTNSIAGEDIHLQVDGNIQFNNVLTTPGVMHIQNSGKLWLLNGEGVTVGKPRGGSGNLTVEGTLKVNENVGLGADVEPGLRLNVGGNIQFNNVLTTPGVMHIQNSGKLWLLNGEGVTVGKPRGGSGNLTVEGTLKVNENIRIVGGGIQSSDGQFTLVMQSDGNLTIQKNLPGGHLTIWASGSKV